MNVIYATYPGDERSSRESTRRWWKDETVVGDVEVIRHQKAFVGRSTRASDCAVKAACLRNHGYRGRKSLSCSWKRARPTKRRWGKVHHKGKGASHPQDATFVDTLSMALIVSPAGQPLG